MNLLDMFKQLSKEEKEEFIRLIKKETQTDVAICIPKIKPNYQKLNLMKFQLFGQ